MHLLSALSEQVLKTKALRSGDKKQGLQQFQASEIADLPPRLRALFEDNKVGASSNILYSFSLLDNYSADFQQC
jgi:hypothetical protein